MTRTASADTIVIKKRELKALLREVVRDELRKVLAQAEPWQLDPESPLYQALVEIREDMAAGRARLLTDEEVWSK
jgi:hypothetical protein